MSVEIKGLDALVKKLDSLGQPGAFRRPMTQSVQHIHRKLAKPPRKAQGAFSRLATPGQKRAFWARVSSGEIEFREGIGYVRTNRLRNSWTTKVSSDGRTGEVGNIVSYGPFVQGFRQQPFHAESKWPQTEKVAKAEQNAVLKFFRLQYERLLKK